MTSSARLTDRTAFITGASSGIGAAIAERYLSEGANVVAVDLDPTGVNALAARHPDRVLALRADVTDETSMTEAVNGGTRRFGPFHVVVANAGAGTYGLIREHDTADWKRIIDLCLVGVFITLKTTADHTADGGSVITISSLNAIQPSAGMSAYCAAKAGVAMLTRVAAMEMGARGIRVNTIAPGLVNTNATAGMFAVPEVVRQFEENASLGRHASPEEVASVAAFLASDDSSYMSASFVSVDGGGNTGRYPTLPAIFSAL
ncbi:MAG: SDR family oxidoreductase [Acidimicrobiia bacterium]|nr:SDR family oxidoreductase [Actinomycetota bacterium]NDH47776.1 SDR family oxidoreductase [Acidimicrobiia bacterium]